MESSWIELLNSDCRDHLGQGRHQDRLEESDWVRTFVSRRECVAGDADHRVSRDALRGLRELLRQLTVSLVKGTEPASRSFEALNRYLAAGPVACRIERSDDHYSMTLQPVAANMEAVLADIARSFARVLTDGDPSRIRICENPDCEWVFYDQSRSRTRRWCAGPSGCGNLLKVRRHRARKKQGGRKNASHD